MRATVCLGTVCIAVISASYQYRSLEEQCFTRMMAALTPEPAEAMTFSRETASVFHRSPCSLNADHLSLGRGHIPSNEVVPTARRKRPTSVDMDLPKYLCIFLI